MKKKEGIIEHGITTIIFGVIVVIGIFIILPIITRFFGFGGADRGDYCIG